MSSKTLTIIAFILLTISAKAQVANPNEGLVNWMPLDEVMQQNQKIQKPILIDFYTDWCGWCKHMMKTTYSDPNISQYINNYFYPVKFNAEGKDTITFLGKTYGPTSDKPKAPHELAVEMLHGALSYPSTVFLNGFDATNNSFAMNMRAPGYLDIPKIEPILVFTVENAFRNSNYDDFGAGFETAFRDTTLNDKLKDSKWLEPAEAFKADSKNTKKSVVLIQTNWCNTCKVMQRASFSDAAVKAYTDSTFRLVNFNAEFPDPIVLNGNTFVNEKNQQMPFHQLAIALTKNNMALPTLAILDEQNNLLDAIPFYMPPDLLNKVLHYYGTDIYKSKTWPEFVNLAP